MIYRVLHVFPTGCIVLVISSVNPPLGCCVGARKKPKQIIYSLPFSFNVDLMLVVSICCQDYFLSLSMGIGICKNMILKAFWPHRGLLAHLGPEQSYSNQMYRKLWQYGTEVPQEG